MSELKLIFHPAYETEIYVSNAGYISIKQTDYPNNDQLVLLSPDQARQFLQALPDLLIDADYLWATTEESE